MSGIYATPKTVSTIDDCVFYHTMEIPGYDTILGQWDLRQGADKYLGGVDVKGKRVLDIGTASGFLSFYMESQGADVIAFDLSEDQSWDVVPYAEHDHQQRRLALQIGKINNAFWFAHHAYKSKVGMVYGSVYEIPSEIGVVDISNFGSVLLHLRDPFRALESALKLTRETVIITDVPLPNNNSEPCMYFQPDFTKGEPWEMWWTLSPELIQRFIGVLGFESSEIKFHEQTYQRCDPERHDRVRLYTVVGQRTKGAPSVRPGMEFEQSLAEKEPSVAERYAALAKWETALAEQEGTLRHARRQAEIVQQSARRQVEIVQQSARRQVEIIQQSLGYRLLEAYRRPVRWLFPPDSRRGLPYRLLVRAVRMILRVR